MRVFFLTVMIACLPMVVAAQTYSDAPIIVDTSRPAEGLGNYLNPTNPEPQGVGANFPEAAITRVGEDTTGMHVDTPATPEGPAPAPQAPVTASPATPLNPASPIAPASPINKLWPRDTLPIFLQSCTGYHPELVAPCTCVITKLMTQMPHDEFLTLSANNSIDNDPRVINIRSECVTTPQRKE